MIVLAKRFLTVALSLWVLPLVAQQDGSPGSGAAEIVVDRHAAALLPIDILSIDPRAPSVGVAVAEEIWNQMSSIEGLYLVAKDLVLPFAGSPLPPEEIARTLGVGSVLETSIQVREGRWQINLELIDAHFGRCSADQDRFCTGGYEYPFAAFDPNGGLPAIDNLDRMAINFYVSVLEENLFPERVVDRRPSLPEARANFLNTSLGEDERLEALRDLSPIMVGPPVRYHEETVKRLWGSVAVAAAQLATESEDPRVRAGVWREMTTVGDPYLIQPLLFSLRNDNDADVRRAAAGALADFLRESDVRYALEYARGHDPSAWVRDEIRLSLLSEQHVEESLR